MKNGLFDRIELTKGLGLRNRVAMAPMTTWSGNSDGTVSDEELDYYRRRVQQAGLVITGCTHVQPNGVGFPGEFAAYDDRFIPSLSRLASTITAGGAKAVLQIFHAGNKALPDQDIVSASPVPTETTAFAQSVTPRALNEDEIQAIIQAFGDATHRAVQAGYDGVELHGAHGFLIQNFISPHTNRREDRWGGTLENRMRFPLAVVAEVKRVAAQAGRPFAVGYRISPEEPVDGGLRIAEALELTGRLMGAGIDYLHVSLADALGSTPLDGNGSGTILSQFVSLVGDRIPVIAAGQIRTAEQAERALAEGLSLVGVGRGLVMDPDWVEHARSGLAGKVRNELDYSEAGTLCLPGGLLGAIESMPGWFPVKAATMA
ncbi:NADH-dependent flavin oxidoreductase [Hyphomonas sp. ND6WE1B]|uniref:NADH-dependent flavin oxidoreductase n=1 Tax=Hyphomonas sp. ND6WE1B TaxID=1848191 RepID=UPI00080769C2|nr:NADH-dependent flavin oxidoreductase [Hyphomonas sp. ND6WE1B]